MFLGSHIKETPDGNYKANIHEDEQGFLIEYFKPSGEKFKTDRITDRSYHYVQDVVENWISGIIPLNE